MLVTCIVPARDAERFLGATLDSLVAQDHVPLEVIVVDDGSSDGTATLAEGYGDPVRVVRQANAGAPAARNHGVRQARGDYLTFLDSDDLYRPSKVSTQLAVLLDDPSLDICECMAQNFWEPGLEEEQARYEAAGRILITHHFETMLAHRSVFDRIGPLNETRHSGDFIDWFQRASDLGVASRVIPDVLIDRRMHVASFSRTEASLDDYFDLAQARIARRRG